MNVLVCGGAGYIGSHVSRLLARRGHQVFVYDDLSKGHRSSVGQAEFILGDIGDRRQLDLVFKSRKIDAVMHFCAFIEVGESVADPARYYRNNLANTLVLLDAMRDHGVDKIIFSSTAAVYGTPKEVPITEDAPKAPINPYGQSKLMVEHVLDDYQAAYGLRSVRFRYFNAAGADESGDIGENHSPESHLIPLVLDAALGVRPEIKIFGTDYPTPDGTAVRDYIHVNDLADAHVRGVEYLGNGGATRAMNLGTGRGYSVREVIEVCRKVTGRAIPVVETARRAGDPPSLVAGSAAARSVLGWEPARDLETMVATAWAWHRKLRA